MHFFRRSVISCRIIRITDYTKEDLLKEAVEQARAVWTEASTELSQHGSRTEKDL